MRTLSTALLFALVGFLTSCGGGNNTSASSTNARSFAVPSNWNASNTARADAGLTQGKLHRAQMPKSALTDERNRGRWRLHASDQILGNVGTRIQWHVITQGDNECSAGSLS